LLSTFEVNVKRNVKCINIIVTWKYNGNVLAIPFFSQPNLSFSSLQCTRRKIVICNQLFVIVIVANDILQLQTIVVCAYYNCK
jgi:hypothetical protein